MSFIDDMYNEPTPVTDNSNRLIDNIRFAVKDICRKNKDSRNASGYYRCFGNPDSIDIHTLVEDVNQASAFSMDTLNNYHITKEQFKSQILQMINELGITQAEIEFVDQSASSFAKSRINTFFKRERTPNGQVKYQYQKEPYFYLYIRISW